MTGTARRVHAARGHLARRVAVLAVFAGLAVAVGLQCTDGMTMPMAHSANAEAPTACGSPTVMAASHSPARVTLAVAGPLTATCADSGAVGTTSLTADDSPGSHGLGGILATCLAFLVAVVAAVAALRPTGLGSVVRMLRSAPVVMIRAIRPAGSEPRGTLLAADIGEVCPHHGPSPGLRACCALQRSAWRRSSTFPNPFSAGGFS